MIPLALDPNCTALGVAGNGALALRRLRALRRAGAERVVVFADAPVPELRAEAGAQWRAAWPDDAALAALHVLWIAGLPAEAAGALAGAARRLRVLVNVEDVPEHCDFHSVAEIRRGDLLLTVSTNRAAPGLAAAIRRRLEGCFAPEWAERVAQVAALRDAWRAEGVAMPETARRIAALVEARCWLACPRADH